MTPDGTAVHIELQYVVPELYPAFPPASVDGIALERPRRVVYSDTYFDTEHLDLHADNLMLRARGRIGRLEFFDFKGGASYAGPLIMRRFATEPISSEYDIAERLATRVVSGPMQALYAARSDLIGKPLSEKVRIEVDKTTFDVHISEATDAIAKLSFHQYKYFISSNKESGPLRVVELQPPRPLFAANQGALLARAAEALDDAGFRRSPSTKYHRVPRGDLE